MAAPSAWDVGTLDFCGELQARGPGSGSGLVMGIARGGVETAAAAEPDDELQWAVPESWTPWQAVSVPSAYATVSSRSDSWGQPKHPHDINKPRSLDEAVSVVRVSSNFVAKSTSSGC